MLIVLSADAKNFKFCHYYLLYIYTTQVRKIILLGCTNALVELAGLNEKFLNDYILKC